MEKKNSVYIVTSLDGYIADKEGKIDWLDTVNIPADNDMGFYQFMDRIDALVMGRVTFETVLSFDVEWPYQKPVFVLSNSLNEIPKSHQGKAFLLSGDLQDNLKEIHQQGYTKLYIDGGTTIQSFLSLDLIDEMIITIFPILLGGGSPLFGKLDQALKFKPLKSEIYFDSLIQHHFIKDES